MDRRVGQAVQGLNQLFSPENRGFRHGFTGHHLGEAGPGGNRGYTAARAETHFGDPSVGKLDRQRHNVPADGVLQTDLGVGVGQVAHVARMLEMVEDFLGVAHTL
jgi:hypothetical protein